MKQIKSRSKKKGSTTLLGGEEIEVSVIMLNLPDLISESERCHKFPFSWGGRRRRSALDSTKPPPPASSQRETTERRLKVTVRPTSPSTPLSFCPSDSEKATNKRTTEGWLKMIDELTHSRKLLIADIEAMRSYHRKLNGLNLDLKAKKQELTRCPKTEEPHLEKSRNCNLGMKLEPQEHYLLLQQQRRQQQQFIMHQSVFGSHESGRFQYPWPQRRTMPPPYSLGLVNASGPQWIPDTKVSGGEASSGGYSQPFDLHSYRVRIEYRFRAAEARRRRMLKRKGGRKNFERPLDFNRLRYAEARKRRAIILKSKRQRIRLQQ